MSRTNYYEERDQGYEKLREAFEALDGVSATVGVHEKDNQRDDDQGGPNLAALLSIHEFGAVITEHPFVDKIVIPARPVLRGTLSDNLDTLLDRQERLLVRVLDGEITEVQMFGQLGAWAQGKVRERFGSETLAPNAESTIAQKGSSAPLIDTGQLRQSIDYQVQQ